VERSTTRCRIEDESAMTVIIIIPFCVMGALGLAMAVGLGLAAMKFAVEVDPRIELVNGVLPGANCGACGFAGCVNYAKAVVEGKAKANVCTAGGETAAKQIADIMGIEAAPIPKAVAKVFCEGDLSEKRQKGAYEGVRTCASAALVGGGTVMCSFGCLGFDDCIRACPWGGIKARENLPPRIDETKCIACGLCVSACPRKLIRILPKGMDYTVACSSHDRGKYVKRVCDVGCTACRACVKKCPEKAITVENNLAVINYELCKNRGECLKACPTKCIQWKNVQPS
jgi:electron transport complex protein RnfB